MHLTEAAIKTKKVALEHDIHEKTASALHYASKKIQKVDARHKENKRRAAVVPDKYKNRSTKLMEKLPDNTFQKIAEATTYSAHGIKKLGDRAKNKNKNETVQSIILNGNNSEVKVETAEPNETINTSDKLNYNNSATKDNTI